MKFKEIGSNFYTSNFISSGDLDDHIIKEKYNLTNSIVYPSLGRNAISIVLKEINVKKKVALLPGYTCETVIEPFINENYELVFYNFHKDLTINLVDLKSKLANYSPTVLLIHGFYGYNTFLSAKTLIQSARENGCIIIEDDTQTVFSEIEILPADYYLGSLRKWLEIPDGAYICSSNKLPEISSSINVDFITQTTEAFMLKASYTKNMDANLKLQYKGLYLEAQNLIDSDFTCYKMADISKGILNGYNLEEMKRKRIENFNFLLNNIQNKYKGIISVFTAAVANNICPIYFPLYVEKREIFQSVLSEKDIYATIIWPRSNFITELDSETEYIYDKVIGIPCDQRYNIKDLQRVLEVINSCFEKY